MTGLFGFYVSYECNAGQHDYCKDKDCECDCHGFSQELEPE